MKKIVVLTLLALTFLFSGCSLFDAEPKEFSGSGMTLTLDDTFSESSILNAQLYLISTKHGFTGNGERKSDLSDYATTLEEYGELISDVYDKDLEYKTYSDSDTSFLYSTYEASTEDGDFSYMIVLKEGESKFYCMNFFCRSKDFEKSEDQYLEWAKTIRVE